MTKQIEVTYEYTSNAFIALKWLNELDGITAFDFEATGLGHPSKETLTHLSFANSESHGRVIVFENKKIEQVVLNWLTTTKIPQIWHNASYDFKFIWHRTGKFPLVYEDTAILAKTITNHVNVFKSKVGLKELMGHYYGDWAVSSELFSLDNLKNETLIKYAAIDACATYKLWNQIQEYIKMQRN